ncbi:heme biosynthesis HemY N-terminal domain-containing protein [Colwellia sp. MEBiC06753]
MLKTIILIILFFAAVAISPVLIGEKGYILIAMGDLTIESTVVTAGLFLIILFFAILLTLKLIKGGIRFGFGTWHKIAFASKRRGQRDYQKGVAAYLLGDYQQAEHLLAKSAEPAEQQSTAYLIAAKAAQHQELTPHVERYIQLLEHHGESLKNKGLESVLVTIDILITQNNLAKARAILNQHHSYIGQDNRLLAQEIKVSIAEKRFANAIGYLPKAQKAKDISTEQIASWKQQAYYGEFTQLVANHSNQALHEYWQSLARKIKQDEIVLAEYCRVLAEQNIIEPLTKLLLPIFTKGHNHPFIDYAKGLPLTHTEALISAVQKHLHHDQHDSFWLSCLGHLANADKQWPLAERAFSALNSKQRSNKDKKGLALALNAQGKYQQAAEILLMS